MKVYFTDGMEGIANAVIGCDGNRSTCGKIMLGEKEPRSCEGMISIVDPIRCSYVVGFVLQSPLNQGDYQL